MAELNSPSPRAIAFLAGIVEIEEDQYVAQCLELGTATQADTETRPGPICRRQSREK